MLVSVAVEQASTAPDSSGSERNLSRASDPSDPEESTQESLHAVHEVGHVLEAEPSHNRVVVPQLSLTQRPKRPTGNAHTHTICIVGKLNHLQEATPCYKTAVVLKLSFTHVKHTSSPMALWLK